MRKHLGLFIITSLFGLIVSGCNGSGSKKQVLSFKESEYQIHSGDRITVEQNYKGVVYAFVGSVPNETTLNDKTGEITFTKNTPNYAQVILTASYKQLQSDQAVVTLLQNEVTTELEFHTPIKNITDGDYILVTSTNKETAITYSLENEVLGVSIDSMSGRVHFTSAAVEGSNFTVVASSANCTIKDTYVVTTNHLAVSKTKSDTHEIGTAIPATYVLDFSDTPAGTQKTILGIMFETKYANENEFEFDPVSETLVINPSFLETLSTGENELKIITPRNIIKVNMIMVTKYIRNAHDLQSINDSREALSGYYILENDIDLTSYLAKGGEGYNDARGWNQIGIYHDLEKDPTRDSFNGTFDGNGHIISGYFEERTDDFAHNEGLFGYLTNQAVVKNVGFVGDPTHNTTGRNYIGGFVGFNEGTILNCWSKVNISNHHEDHIFNSVGAFVGGNSGLIQNCYTLGDVKGDNYVGAFAGKNFGELTNCFSLNKTGLKFCGTNVNGEMKNCQSFDTEADMKAFDFSAYLDAKYWTFAANKLPELKNLYDIEYANGLEISNTLTDLSKDQDLTLEVAIHPNSLRDQYINDVVYSMTSASGSGITISNNVYHISGATVNEFTAIATLETEFATFSAAKTFKIYEPISSITFVDDLPNYVEPGKQYALNVDIQPSTAPQEVTWEILQGLDDKGRTTHPERFSFITGNILTIEETMMNFRQKDANRTFEVRATAKDGKSVTKELKVKKINYLGDTYCVSLDGDNITQNVLTFYKDTTETHISFVLPSSADLAGVIVTRYSARIYDFTRTGHTIKIPIKYIQDIPNKQLDFTFRCGSGDSQVIYRGYACYIDHNRYTASDVPGQYVALGSAQDFYDNFRMKKTDKDNTYKWENYDKTFVLTNDIDFEGATGLLAIGYHSSSYQNADHPFKGKIYGFGHKIMNAKFEYSERMFFAGETPEGQRDPNKDRIGVFGYFQGQLYDVHFENIIVDARVHGGCLAGVIQSGGYLENVTFRNCKATSVNEVDYTIDDVIQGRVAGSSAGTFVAVTYNGTAVGLVGQFMKKINKILPISLVLLSATGLCLSLGQSIRLNKVSAEEIGDYGDATRMQTMTLYGDTRTQMGFTWTTTNITKTNLQVLEKSVYDASTGFDDPAVTSSIRYYDGTIEASKISGDGFIHRVHADGLTPDTEYCYRFGDEEVKAWCEVGTFKTSANSSRNFTFAHISDPQGDNELHYESYNLLLNDLSKTQNPEFIALTGDITDDSHFGESIDLHEWELALTNQWGVFKDYPVATVSGNHDGADNAFASRYTYDIPQGSETRTGLYYSFDYQGVHFTCLDSNDTSNPKDPNTTGISDAQLSWCEQDLAKHKDDKFLIVMMHKGMFDSGGHSNNDDFHDYDIEVMRHQLAPLFTKYGVDLVLEGHDHLYNLSYPIIADEYQGQERNYQIDPQYKVSYRDYGDYKNVYTFSNLEGTFYFNTGTATGQKYYAPIIGAPMEDYIFDTSNPNQKMYTLVDVRDTYILLRTYTCSSAGTKLFHVYAIAHDNEGEYAGEQSGYDTNFEIQGTYTFDYSFQRYDYSATVKMTSQKLNSSEVALAGKFTGTFTVDGGQGTTLIKLYRTGKVVVNNELNFNGDKVRFDTTGTWYMDDKEELVITIYDEKDSAVTYKASKEAKKNNNGGTIAIIVVASVAGVSLLAFGAIVVIGFIIGGSAFAVFTGKRKKKKEDVGGEQYDKSTFRTYL